MEAQSVAKKVIGLVGVLACLAVFAVVGVAGYFIYHCVVPEKMDVAGRVVDSSGRGVGGVEVRAVPLPLADPYSDSEMKPQDTEHTVMSDEDGRYRFRGLVASVGVKEGRCMQGYHIVARSGSRSSAVIRVCKHPDDRSKVIEVENLVLGERGDSAAGGGGL
ncbi:MAG: carboxypeptidase-like regulatory domain-containing protein [Planctomycetota bacterium]|jgi:hypothetical protein